MTGWSVVAGWPIAGRALADRWPGTVSGRRPFAARPPPTSPHCSDGRYNNASLTTVMHTFPLIVTSRSFFCRTTRQILSSGSPTSSTVCMMSVSNLPSSANADRRCLNTCHLQHHQTIRQTLHRIITKLLFSALPRHHVWLPQIANGVRPYLRWQIYSIFNSACSHSTVSYLWHRYAM